ncbi:MAG: hypothetical protein AAFX53_09030 [Bacteroidota bacterium]
MDRDTRILAYGDTKNLPKAINVKAGKLHMVYEAGFLRYIKLGDVEIIRMVNHALRDHDWDTVPMQIMDERLEDHGNSFIITYTAVCKTADIHFQWHCVIKGNPDSTIDFEIQGMAYSAFRKNRAGFTVLHPIAPCIGKRCTITHPNGQESVEKFPTYISPSQPFKEVSAMSWEPANGVYALLAFEGDVFETEDQRNWIDASYKTYCTPLGLPFPVRLEVGDTIKQKIRLSLDTTNDGAGNAKGADRVLKIDRKNPRPFPKIGIPLGDLEHTPDIIDYLKALHIDFLRVELEPGKWDAAKLEHAVSLAKEIDCKLEVVLFFEKNLAETYLEYLLPHKERIFQFIVLPNYAKSTDQPLLEAVVPSLRSYFPHCSIGAGTDAFFKELNDYGTPPDTLDFLSFSVNPQVHAFDLGSLTETLSAHQYVVRSGKVLAQGKKVHVGPVSLRMRWNPNATSRSRQEREILSSEKRADPRQLSLYGAAWTLGSFKYLSENGAASTTYYQTCGPSGLMPHPGDTWPEELTTIPQAVYPIYIILKQIMGHKNGKIVPLESPNPLKYDGMAFLDRTKRITLLLTNFTDVDQPIGLGAHMEISRLQILDSTLMKTLVQNPDDEIPLLDHSPKNKTLNLPPFATAIVLLAD